jgi:phosphoribosyl 1,2-cyclic phosphodiesterase
MMRMLFRGVRGSVPWAAPSCIGHGCNTPCVEISDDRTGAVLVIDAGSGIVGVNLGAYGEPPPLTLLLSHYHWDHLLGLPFFAGLYAPGWAVNLHTPSLASHDPSWLDTLFKSPFFPVPYQHLPNRPDVRMVRPGPLAIAGFDVTALPLNHPGGAFAYRIRGETGDFVYASDHEFGDPAFDEPLAAFARGAAGLVLDAHFTPAELPHFRGWGHSDWQQCVEFAAANDIGNLWLFHHKPGRTDEQLVEISSSARQAFRNTETACEGEGANW